MVDGTRRLLLLSLSTLPWCGSARASGARPERLRLATPARSFDVLAFRGPGAAGRPAVLVMGGSKGYGSPSYALLAAALDRVGADAHLIGYLTEGDEAAMRGAGSARARIARYGERMADWAATIRVTMEALRRRDPAPTRFGVLGVSLGAMPALTAAVDGADIGALAVVDGSLPDEALARVRSLPPLLALWGEADRVFPVAAGERLDALARRLGGPSRLATYPGQGHAFFVGGGPAAASARATVADFFAARL